MSSRFLHKPQPLAIARKEKRAKRETSDRTAKAAVRERDKKRCRVCGRHTTEVHEGLQFKSLGGVASLQNSFCACSPMNGNGICHQLLQAHCIRVIGDHASEILKFEMTEKTAKAVFGNRSYPAHVVIVE